MKTLCSFFILLAQRGSPRAFFTLQRDTFLHAAMSHKYVFDYQDGELFWCTADVGWITGHSYIIYGPLANGAKTLIFEGVPTYPDGSRFWNVIDKHHVNIFYTAPTAIRSLMSLGDGFVTKTSRRSLRVLGSVGEPINPRRGSGITKWLEKQDVQSWILGGRPKLEAL